MAERGRLRARQAVGTFSRSSTTSRARSSSFARRCSTRDASHRAGCSPGRARARDDASRVATPAAGLRRPVLRGDALDDLMCSTAAPLDSCSAFVRASIIFGTDSSVTRRSYSFTSMDGMSAPSKWSQILRRGAAASDRRPRLAPRGPSSSGRVLHDHQVCSFRPGCVASPSASVSFSMSVALVSSLMR